MPVTDNYPKALRPYKFHGLAMSWSEGREQVQADCPFCGKEGKLWLNAGNGLWDCKVCGLTGNSYTFVRELWRVSDEATTDYDELVADRGYVNSDGLMRWGVCKSVITDEWLVPGYNRDGKMCQLYRYVSVEGKYRLWATTDMEQQLLGVNLYDPKKPEVWLCEGVWDCIALWELLRGTKRLDDGTYTATANEGASLLKDVNTLGVAGATIFNDAWLPLFAGKRVVMAYHNDYPRKHPTTGKDMAPAGFSALKRMTKTFASAEAPPTELSYVNWGPGGFDRSLKDGYDVRDVATAGPAKERVKNVPLLLSRVSAIPQEWLVGVTRSSSNGKPATLEVECATCTDWRALTNAWRKAMKWTEGLDRALSVMLSCIVTTETPGDQLWIKVMGPASCGKTTLCEAVSVAKKYVVANSTMRGFHSGYGPKDEDNSLIRLLYNKTLVTKDGDSLLTAPNLSQILAEARDIYDRTSRTHYRTGKSKDYEGVNMTWVLCGTSSLRVLDSSELGERFLDCVIMEGINEEEEDDILSRIGNRVVSNMRRVDQYASNGFAKMPGISQEDFCMLRAKQLTGGYINYLRQAADDLLQQLGVDQDAQSICAKYAKFVAYMRARPSAKQTEATEREFAGRLYAQHLRMMMCIAVSLGERAVNDEVLRRTKRVATDTARGVTSDMTKHLHLAGRDGLDPRTIGILCNRTTLDINNYLRFLRQIKAVEVFTNQVAVGLKGQQRYRLTQRMHNLYSEVMS